MLGCNYDPVFILSISVIHALIFILKLDKFLTVVIARGIKIGISENEQQLVLNLDMVFVFDFLILYDHLFLWNLLLFTITKLQKSIHSRYSWSSNNIQTRT